MKEFFLFRLISVRRNILRVVLVDGKRAGLLTDGKGKTKKTGGKRKERGSVFMRNKFEEELKELNTELIAMGALCAKAISEAAAALLNDDLSRIEKCGKSII